MSIKSCAFSTTTEPQKFLYPPRSVYPVDNVCYKIVKALESRHWQVPGFEVIFHEDTIDKVHYIRVWRILGPDFKLWFARSQGLPFDCKKIGIQDTAGVMQLGIPQKQLNIFDNKTCPVLYVATKEHSEPSRGNRLRYSCVHTAMSSLSHEVEQTQENLYLVPVSELGNECERGAKSYYSTDEVYREFNNHLEKALKSIESK